MPEFRKCIIALAALTLSAGLASAQVGTPTGGPSGTAFTCGTTNGSVTPTLRAEGYTELTGDMVIVCSGGGAPLALGTPIPTANFTIFLNTAVTSRLLQTTTAGNASEALLLIDEPGSSLTGYGPSVPQTLCTTPAQGALGVGGCNQWVGNSTNGGSGVPVSVNPATGTTLASPQPPGANIFQGVVNGNSVTFYGVPVLPPTSIGLTRVFRITNIRANANQLTSGGPTPGTVQASISINSSTSLIITNSQLTTGFVQQGLSSTNTLVKNGSNTGNASSGGTTFNQCSSASSPSNVALLQYQEAFATAFKTRIQNNPILGGYGSATVVQNIPGTIYNSESGFYLSSSTFSNNPGFGANTAGLADYGTRLKATFTNVPSGVSLYVSTRDVVNSYTTPVTGTAQAMLVVSEGAVDSGLPPSPNTIPAATQTGVFTSGSNTVPYAPVVVSNGTGAATWEIVAATPSQIQTVLFSVFISYTANPANNSPAAPSTIGVSMSFAPTPSGGLFTSSSGAVASVSLPIPRFSDSLNIQKNLANFAICQTALLYPYVINTNGFDTGLAVANTTTDPFGTTAQNGTCDLHFYGSSAPSADFITPSIGTGTVYANLASTLAPGFSGYIIAVCNFQYAHGFAFVSDVGARNLAMGYLALVVNNGSISARGPSGEALNN